jgi:hypothetical protein
LIAELGVGTCSPHAGLTIKDDFFDNNGTDWLVLLLADWGWGFLESLRTFIRHRQSGNQWVI